jgi:hypothetical protein
MIRRCIAWRNRRTHDRQLCSVVKKGPGDHRQPRAVAVAAQHRGPTVAGHPDQKLRAGTGDRAQEGIAVKPPVQQHDHPGAQTAQQPPALCSLTRTLRAEHRVDDRPGSARNQGDQADLGIPSSAVLAPVLPQMRGGSRRVGHIQHGPVDRGHQHATPPHPGRADPGGRTAQQIEQHPQRCDTDPDPGLPHREGRAITCRARRVRGSSLRAHGMG